MTVQNRITIPDDDVIETLRADHAQPRRGRESRMNLTSTPAFPDDQTELGQ